MLARLQELGLLSLPSWGLVATDDSAPASSIAVSSLDRWARQDLRKDGALWRQSLERGEKKGFEATGRRKKKKKAFSYERGDCIAGGR